MLCLHAVTDENGHPLEDEDESGMKLCNCWCKVFESRIQDERHHSHETILDYVQIAPDDIQWEIDQCEFDGMMATKKESAPGPDGIPKSIFGCAVGWVLSSCSTCTNVCLRVALSQNSMQAGPSSFPSLPLSTTMASL